MSVTPLFFFTPALEKWAKSAVRELWSKEEINTAVKGGCTNTTYASIFSCKKRQIQGYLLVMFHVQ